MCVPFQFIVQPHSQEFSLFYSWNYYSIELNIKGRYVLVVFVVQQVHTFVHIQGEFVGIKPVLDYGQFLFYAESYIVQTFVSEDQCGVVCKLYTFRIF